jgi:hypothetical protein
VSTDARIEAARSAYYDYEFKTPMPEFAMTDAIRAILEAADAADDCVRVPRELVFWALGCFLDAAAPYTDEEFTLYKQGEALYRKLWEERDRGDED